MMKRTLDVIASALGLLLIWPIWIVVAILIKLDSRGPILFKQIRIGKGFRPFAMYKFRTMVEDASLKGGPITIGQDPRVTKIGWLLRRSKLDELPQLLNILRGDMSLVGPRPEVPHYVQLFAADFSDILKVRPGLTDLASLKYMDESTILQRADQPESEYRNTILPEKIRLAKFYVAHASLTLDLAIITQTILSLLRIPVVVCEMDERQVPLGHDLVRKRHWLIALLLRYRRPLIVVLDVGLIMLANGLAFGLRFDGNIPDPEWDMFLQALPWLVVIRGVMFLAFHLNEGLWRYTSLWDLQNILFGVLLSSVLFSGWIYWGLGMTDYPRSIIVIDFILLIGFMAGVRLPRRMLREAVIFRPRKRVLIIGAGDTGERIAREMKMNRAARYQPIGFIDNRISLRGKTIHGIKVLGGREELGRILTLEKPHEVVLALPNLSPEAAREIVSALGSFKVVISRLPDAHYLHSDRSAISQIRAIAAEDLLPRARVNLQTGALGNLITGRRILITGAGGSIGSELSRQIASLRPEVLVLYERHENSLYSIAKELDDSGLSSQVNPILGDVTDRRRLAETLNRFRPGIVFHAAAHKHVPLVERNPAEALKNNCIGTRIVADMASRAGVERFVLISTDKAVNPSSVMGATKRAAELIVQDMAQRSATRFLTVRFGNVLGSSGSVLLRFQEQIRSGGPVTVTHPEIRRYFMLIPEAVHLVLQAASLGEQGATYVLDMGEQIKVLDLAKNLIRLSGFAPGRDIPIRFIGLRPGEKLYEELVGLDENAEMSRIERIMRICPTTHFDASRIQSLLTAMEAAAYLNNTETAVERLREMVPAFRTPDLAEAPLTQAREWVEEEPAFSVSPQ